MCDPGWGCSHQGLDWAGTAKMATCMAVALVLAPSWLLSGDCALGSPPCGFSVWSGLLRAWWLGSEKQCFGE